jgi:hypothetical protein
LSSLIWHWFQPEKTDLFQIKFRGEIEKYIKCYGVAVFQVEAGIKKLRNQNRTHSRRSGEYFSIHLLQHSFGKRGVDSAFFRTGQIVSQLVIITLLTYPDMTGGMQSGRFIQGAGSHGNGFSARGMPEQRGTALTAKSPLDVGGLIGDGVIPLQAGLLNQLEIRVSNAGVRADVAMKPTAFRTMAVHDVSERAVNFVSDRSA